MSDPLAQYKADYIAELEDSVRENMAAGVPLEDVVASIEEAGLPRDDAALVVAKVESRDSKKPRSRYARKHELFRMSRRRGGSASSRAASTCFGGTAVTINTYILARPGGMYFILYGIIAAGLRFLTGISDLRDK